MSREEKLPSKNEPNRHARTPRRFHGEYSRFDFWEFPRPTREKLGDFFPWIGILEFRFLL
jgi:hypothetical protein